jgi:hypothetical protein
LPSYHQYRTAREFVAVGSYAGVTVNQRLISSIKINDEIKHIIQLMPKKEDIHKTII